MHPSPGPGACAGIAGAGRGPVGRPARGMSPRRSGRVDDSSAGSSVDGNRPDRSPGTRPRGTRSHGSITILRERISKWVLIEILNFFHSLSTVICKIHLALI